MSKRLLKMVEEYQCPGCMHGCSPKTCDKYKLATGGYGSWCDGHRPSTFMMNVGRIALGLPKGFNRYGSGVDPEPRQKTTIRLFAAVTPVWDKFNVAVWKMVKDGALFVRTYSPRVNACYVDVIDGGTLDMAPGAVDVGPFWEEID